MEHIRRPEANNQNLVAAFRAVVQAVQKTPGTALRIVFRKKDNSIRTMDVAFDDNLAEAFAEETPSVATERRKVTNEARGNLAVRERIRDEGGNYTFQWRTIPLARVLSVSPCI